MKSMSKMGMVTFISEAELIELLKEYGQPGIETECQKALAECVGEDGRRSIKLADLGLADLCQKHGLPFRVATFDYQKGEWWWMVSKVTT